MKMHPRYLLGVVALVSMAACKDINVGTPAKASIRIVNASASQLTMYLDGFALIQGVQVGSVSPLAEVPEGTHAIQLSAGGVLSPPYSIDARSTRTMVIAGVPNGTTGLTAQLFTDSGSVVPAGKSKLRVVHLSANAGNIEIWRTQPDFQTPVHILTPFAYRAESPYLQSDPGTWEVFITAAGTTGPKLATTGPINIPSGERRTAVLLDSAGTRFFRVLPE